MSRSPEDEESGGSQFAEREKTGHQKVQKLCSEPVVHSGDRTLVKVCHWCEET